MANLKEELWKILQDLKEDDFRTFKWFLNQGDKEEGVLAIPTALLENAARKDVVDLLVQTYQGRGAVMVTMKVLKKIPRNDLVECLDNSTRETKEPKNHECAALKGEFEREKVELQTTVKLMIQERQTKIQEIKGSAELSSKSAATHIADSEQAVDMLLRTLKESLNNLIISIKEEQKMTQSKADGFIQELEQEISELTKRSTEVEKLPPTKDSLDRIKGFTSQYNIPSSKKLAEVKIGPPSYGKSVAIAVTQLEEKLTKFRKKFVDKGKLNTVKLFAKCVTLDPDTAHPSLILSDDGKQVYCGHNKKQNLSDNSKRFQSAVNVLGKQSFSSGRFYYEVQVRGKTSWDLGVVKESIDRKGSINASPQNGYWTICLRDGKYQASKTSLSVRPQLQRVGVFVDYEKHSVSFFDVDAAEIIHSFTDCSFTERLFPFFSPGLHFDGKNSNPLVISPVTYH